VAVDDGEVRVVGRASSITAAAVRERADPPEKQQAFTTELFEQPPRNKVIHTERAAQVEIEVSRWMRRWSRFELIPAYRAVVLCGIDLRTSGLKDRSKALIKLTR
jgi:hypothetical protein